MSALYYCLLDAYVAAKKSKDTLDSWDVSWYPPHAGSLFSSLNSCWETVWLPRVCFLPQCWAQCAPLLWPLTPSNSQVKSFLSSSHFYFSDVQSPTLILKFSSRFLAFSLFFLWILGKLLILHMYNSHIYFTFYNISQLLFSELKKNTVS